MSASSPFTLPAASAAHSLHTPAGPSMPSQAVAVIEVAARVLERTARSLATTPGGLRFVPGSRPWLQGLPGGRMRRAVGHACVVSQEFFA